MHRARDMYLAHRDVHPSPHASSTYRSKEAAPTCTPAVGRPTSVKITLRWRFRDPGRCLMSLHTQPGHDRVGLRATAGLPVAVPLLVAEGQAAPGVPPNYHPDAGPPLVALSVVAFVPPYQFGLRRWRRPGGWLGDVHLARGLPDGPGGAAPLVQAHEELPGARRSIGAGTVVERDRRVAGEDDEHLVGLHIADARRVPTRRSS